VDRRVALTVIASICVAVLLVAISTSESVPLAERSPSMPFDLPEFDLSQPTPTTLAPEPAGEPSGRIPTRSTDLIGYLQNLLLLGVLVLIGVALKRAWEHRPELIWRPTRRRNDFVRLEEVATSISAEAEAQRAALERGEARNAIVACWSRLEHLVAAVGFERDPADTATEFTARVLTRYRVDPVAIDDLAALYREARFSTHTMGEPERARALTALDAIHAGLAETPDAAVTP
jgi:hypothetical protein